MQCSGASECMSVLHVHIRTDKYSGSAKVVEAVVVSVLHCECTCADQYHVPLMGCSGQGIWCVQDVPLIADSLSIEYRNCL